MRKSNITYLTPVVLSSVIALSYCGDNSKDKNTFPGGGEGVIGCYLLHQRCEAGVGEEAAVTVYGINSILEGCDLTLVI